MFDRCTRVLACTEPADGRANFQMIFIPHARASMWLWLFDDLYNTGRLLTGGRDPLWRPARRARLRSPTHAGHVPLGPRTQGTGPGIPPSPLAKRGKSTTGSTSSCAYFHTFSAPVCVLGGGGFRQGQSPEQIATVYVTH
mmetsp:Transcript_23465/g.39547  ORF Transcript_23465/g.39547 Transcript_23465/m.39547 type:complete len:140 (+) Transcript_23465:776-1195(+)